jgi:hypothetical protein
MSEILHREFHHYESYQYVRDAIEWLEATAGSVRERAEFDCRVHTFSSNEWDRLEALIQKHLPDLYTNRYDLWSSVFACGDDWFVFHMSYTQDNLWHREVYIGFPDATTAVQFRLTED